MVVSELGMAPAQQSEQQITKVGGTVRVKVVMTVDVDPESWVDAYGDAGDSLSEDVRRYIGGLVAGGEATRRQAITGFRLKGVRNPYVED